MSDKFFVDTNILIYAHDASAGMKRTVQVVNPLLEPANR
jgi:predicted nucleic acid-binding protein